MQKGCDALITRPKVDRLSACDVHACNDIARVITAGASRTVHADRLSYLGLFVHAVLRIRYAVRYAGLALVIRSFSVAVIVVYPRAALV